MSLTVRLKNSACHFSIARRISPSVISPTTWHSSFFILNSSFFILNSSFFTAIPSPSFPLLTRIMASPRCISGGNTGRSSLNITSCAVVSSRLPISPPGWNCAKSLGWKFRFSIKAIARASPIASCAIVELVGARFIGQASFSTRTFRWQVEYFASSDWGLPLMPMIGICMWSTIGINLSSSSVCPEFEMASTTSSVVITPRSP